MQHKVGLKVMLPVDIPTGARTVYYFLSFKAFLAALGFHRAAQVERFKKKTVQKKQGKSCNKHM